MVCMYALGQSVIFHLSKKYAALLAYLKVGDNGMLYIFFLFLQEVKWYCVQCVGPQFVVS